MDKQCLVINGLAFFRQAVTLEALSHRICSCTGHHLTEKEIARELSWAVKAGYVGLQGTPKRPKYVLK